MILKPLQNGLQKISKVFSDYSDKSYVSQLDQTGVNMNLLSPAHTNAKTAKNASFTRYHSAILHLAPFDLSGINVCPAASKGCAMACLNTAGRGAFSTVQNARIRKTKEFFANPQAFFAMLIKDIEALSRKAAKQGQLPVVRLNGTSDIAWENYEAKDGLNIFEVFPNVQFYDYTKRIERLNHSELPRNYHLTFSASEVNSVVSKRALKLGFNVAVVFFKGMPESYWGAKCIDGDSHDLRFLEGYSGAIIALKAKGKAKRDTSGFVRNAA